MRGHWFIALEITEFGPITGAVGGSGLRRLLFERDGWKCQYCGELVTEQTATLDHRIPVSKGGDDSEGNLATACLMCNSLKSGKSYEEAAPLILASIRQRQGK